MKFHPKINSIEQLNKKKQEENAVMVTKQMFNDNNCNLVLY